MGDLLKIGFNPQDRFMVAVGEALAVTTQDGSVFAGEVVGRELRPVIQWAGDRIGFNPQDRFLVALGNTLAVITRDGSVFGSDVMRLPVPFIPNMRGLSPVFRFTGARIGFNPQDRFMVALGNTLAVITQDGSVFGADVVGRDVRPVFQYAGARIGFNPQDRFMVALGNTLVVVTRSGEVFGADVAGREIGPVFQFQGSRIGFSPQDRFMVAMGNTLVVVTHEGNVFGADVAGREIGPVYQVNHLPETKAFDSGQLSSDLPLGGSAHLVMRKNGNFTFSTDAHDSGFDNIDYVVSAVLMTPSGIAFTFQHSGNVEGTVAGLPFGTPRRDDHSSVTSHNGMITAEWEGITQARLTSELDGRDTLIGGLEDALKDLVKKAAAELGKAAATAVIALVV